MIITFDKWRVNHKYLRIQHNKRVNRWFKLEISSSKGRTNLRNSLLIYSKDSAQQITAKITYFNSIQLEYLDIEIPASAVSWNVRPGNNIPQLAIIYRSVEKNNKSGNYVTHIPHFNGNKNPKFANHTKGNFWAKLILKDGSNVVTHGKTESQAESNLKELARYIDTKYKSNNIKQGQYKHKINKEIKVKPIRGDFYKLGKEQGYPTWSISFDK